MLGGPIQHLSFLLTKEVKQSREAKTSFKRKKVKLGRCSDTNGYARV